jgi:hypothetical protein
MAYSGATAASSLANPPVRIGGYLGSGANTTAFGVAAGLGAKSLWMYNSSHSSTQLTDTAFFSDAYYLGMKQGDLVVAACNAGSSASVCMGVLGAVTTAGAAFASTGGILSSTR